MLRDKMNASSFGSVEINRTYNAETRELAITVSGDAPMAGSRLTVLLTQSGMAGAQSGASGTYTHNNAPRAFLTETFGKTITYNNGRYSETFNYTIPASVGSHNCIAEDMEIVAFLANYDASSNLRSEVINAAKISVVGNTRSLINNQDEVSSVATLSSKAVK